MMTRSNRIALAFLVGTVGVALFMALAETGDSPGRSGPIVLQTMVAGALMVPYFAVAAYRFVGPCVHPWRDRKSFLIALILPLVLLTVLAAFVEPDAGALLQPVAAIVLALIASAIGAWLATQRARPR